MSSSASISPFIRLTDSVSPLSGDTEMVTSAVGSPANRDLRCIWNDYADGFFSGGRNDAYSPLSEHSPVPMRSEAVSSPLRLFDRVVHVSRLDAFDSYEKTLRFEDCIFDDSENILQTIQIRFPELNSLTLIRCKNLGTMSSLSMRSLTEINFEGTLIDDDLALWLSKSPQLKKMTVSQDIKTRDNLQFSALESLNVHGVVPASIISASNNIKRLYLHGAFIEYNSLSGLIRGKDIKAINLLSCYLSDGEERFKEQFNKDFPGVELIVVRGLGCE